MSGILHLAYSIGAPVKMHLPGSEMTGPKTTGQS